MSITTNFQSSIYVLDDRSNTFNDIDYRWGLVNYYFNTNRINMESVGTYGSVYTLLPEYLLAAAYIPFNHKYYDLNFNYLTLNDTLVNDYYTKVYENTPEIADVSLFKLNTLDTNLKDTIKSLNDREKIYNKLNFLPVIIVCCLVWFVIIMFLLKILYYYYYEYYGMIIISMSISLLIFGVIWKMIHIMRS